MVAEPFEDYFSSYPKDMTDWERLVLTCVTEELDLASVAQLDKKRTCLTKDYLDGSYWLSRLTVATDEVECCLIFDEDPEQDELAIDVVGPKDRAQARYDIVSLDDQKEAESIAAILVGIITQQLVVAQKTIFGRRYGEAVIVERTAAESMHGVTRYLILN